MLSKACYREYSNLAFSQTIHMQLVSAVISDVWGESHAKSSQHGKREWWQHGWEACAGRSGRCHLDSTAAWGSAAKRVQARWAIEIWDRVSRSWLVSALLLLEWCWFQPSPQRFLAGGSWVLPSKGQRNVTKNVVSYYSKAGVPVCSCSFLAKTCSTASPFKERGWSKAVLEEKKIPFQADFSPSPAW